MTTVVLIGFRGVGKSTIAQHLADSFASNFLDLDAVLVRRLGAPLAEFARREGEAAFRQEESQALADLIAERRKHGTLLFLALGGGTLESPLNQKALREQKQAGWHILWLQADFPSVMERLRAQKSLGTPERLPFGGERSELCVFQERAEIYADLADHCIETSNKTASAVAEAAKSWIRQIQLAACDR